MIKARRTAKVTGAKLHLGCGAEVIEIGQVGRKCAGVQARGPPESKRWLRRQRSAATDLRIRTVAFLSIYRQGDINADPRVEPTRRGQEPWRGWIPASNTTTGIPHPEPVTRLTNTRTASTHSNASGDAITSRTSPMRTRRMLGSDMPGLERIPHRTSRSSLGGPARRRASWARPLGLDDRPVEPEPVGIPIRDEEPEHIEADENQPDDRLDDRVLGGRWGSGRTGTCPGA